MITSSVDRATPFDLRVELGPVGMATVHLRGDLDLAARQPAVDGFRSIDLEPGHTLTLDLSEVTFCDSTGLLTLLEIRRRTEASGGQLILRSLPEGVRQVLDLTALSSEFAIDT